MTHALTDSFTLLRRNLLHVKRYPIALFTVGIPVVLLLLFVYVFGNTLGMGLARGGGRAAYADYIARSRCWSPSRRRRASPPGWARSACWRSSRSRSPG